MTSSLACSPLVKSVGGWGRVDGATIDECSGKAHTPHSVGKPSGRTHAVPDVPRLLYLTSHAECRCGEQVHGTRYRSWRLVADARSDTRRPLRLRTTAALAHLWNRMWRIVVLSPERRRVGGCSSVLRRVQQVR